MRSRRARGWKSLDDPLLDTLVDEMLQQSPTLREAQGRLAEARANRDAVRGATLPQAQASASGNEVVLSKNGQIPIGSIPGFSRELGLFDLGFDASWEIDLWGHGRRQIEAARAREAQAEMAAQGTRLQLIAELARAYVDLRLAQRETACRAGAGGAAGPCRPVGAAGEGRRGGPHRVGAGRLRRRQCAGHARQAQASERAAALRVATLGRRGARRDAAPAGGGGGVHSRAARSHRRGLPAELLRRGPDIRTAERDLAAATADVGVATADLPRLSLGLSVGQQARAVGDLFSGDSTRLQVGPSLVWPVFSGGSTRARIRAAGARVDQAAARYDAAVIGALADSETAINRFDRARAALAASDAALERDSAVLALAEQRRAAGEDDALALARARLAYVAAVQRSAQARAAATDAAIALNKALGGGWDKAGG